MLGTLEITLPLEQDLSRLSVPKELHAQERNKTGAQEVSWIEDIEAKIGMPKATCMDLPGSKVARKSCSMLSFGIQLAMSRRRTCIMFSHGREACLTSA